jgi:hypothetical protein
VPRRPRGHQDSLPGCTRCARQAPSPPAISPGRMLERKENAFGGFVGGIFWPVLPKSHRKRIFVADSFSWLRGCTASVNNYTPSVNERLFPGSSAVEQPAVNRLVAGSNPARGAKQIKDLMVAIDKCAAPGVRPGYARVEPHRSAMAAIRPGERAMAGAVGVTP